jgi:3'-phosphoadenosine 5'-phosphosulfate sulfotransferase (PAPS reductase)/FAD synthetase
MALALKAAGIRYRAVFMDTGWEHPDTMAYIRGPLTEAIGDIEEIRGEHTMVSLIRSRGTFPRQLRQFCTYELKVKPMQRFISQMLEEEEVVNAVGIRGSESLRRSRMAPWEHSDGFDCDVWRPLFDWSEDDVIQAHREAGLEPNPLYLRGMSRVGCWPCINASKADLRVFAASDPDRIEEIRALEDEIGGAAQARAKARGEQYDHPPAFFSRALPERARRGFVPVDEIVRWSRTERGGRQYGLGLQTEPGCARWGLCDGWSA